VAWNEEVARYHIACAHELISTETFSSQLNQEQLNKVIGREAPGDGGPV